jgi:hypothetical protein
MGVAELIVASTDWSRLREASGPADRVGHGLSQLLSAGTPEAASDAHWLIENHAVVQGEVFEVAEACVWVLAASLADDRPSHVRIAVLELLFQILVGRPSPQAPTDIIERCKRAALEGLWGLVREATTGQREGAWDVLDQLSLGDRLAAMRDVS